MSAERSGRLIGRMPLPSSIRRSPKSTEMPEDSKALDNSDLEMRRDQLEKIFVELQWDLGGATYEMASRDHFRLDVLVRMAARLQEVDSELAEVERLMRLDDAGASGACPACGALHARGAVFCWQCGNDLMERQPSGGVVGIAHPE